jgi:hypothetical protein
MRRWLLVLLMAILPLQLSWAAMAGCCPHELAPVEEAFHAHEDQGQEAGAQDSHDKPSPLTLDDDCRTCQLGHTPALLSHAPALTPPVLPPRIALQPVLHGSHVPALPERPDRRLA